MSQTCSHTTEADENRRQLEEAMLTERMNQIRQKIVVMSGKGGVGKSTVAVNLALGLARAGFSVGLLDVDIHGPSVPQLLRLVDQGVHIVESELQPLKVMEGLRVMSIGFLLNSVKDAVIWRGPMKYGVIQQFLRDTAWGRLDYLVVDSPPGTGDEPLAVAQLVGKPAVAVLVTTPQDLAVSDVRRSVSFCRAVGLPVLGIVENMSGLVCPSCGHHIDVFKTGGGETLALEMSVPYLGRVPLDPAVVSRGDTGYSLADTAGAGSSTFQPIIQAVLDRTRAGRIELTVIQ
ncbi:MAG TPA: Mrp/NBP35 family ATP-binding protein [Phycisphaerae bacterium]|nr:Mrp/NBP35 family ATP-binding protein [Phycisphaerae bacterium]HRY69794.1 Mrp/NBP35 family ATP-binding protein [Phycisphaerae bacterium]HSA25373.1 Mrp/NBP35 family ATP-binding protein [Phycisphaerae bacterium]